MRRLSAALLACFVGFMPGPASAAELDLGAIIDGWSDGLGRLGQGLAEGLGRGLGLSLQHLNHRYLYPTEGTVSFEETFTWQGRQRKVLFIRPEAASGTPAPAVVMLHYHGGTSQVFANMTYAGELARDVGAWVILPEGVNKKWNDDPAAWNQSVDDVGFLAHVIQSSVAKHGLNGKRVYMAGMSNGGFMTSRFACERPDLIAAGASVAATMRQGLNASCSPSRAVPMTFMLGTSDLQVSYSRTSAWVLLSGPDTLKRWSAIHNCDTSKVVTTAMPDLDPKDKTTTQRLRNEACASGGALEMYVINGGGHTWPQGDSRYTGTLGRTTKDFSGSFAAWDFFQQYQLP